MKAKGPQPRNVHNLTSTYSYIFITHFLPEVIPDYFVTNILLVTDGRYESMWDQE